MSFFLFNSAIDSLWKGKWINLLTTLTVAVALIIIGIFSMLLFNLNLALRHWSEGFGIIVYLKDDINQSSIKAVDNALTSNRDILNVRFISKDDALNELKSQLGSFGDVLSGLEQNPLPSSFEIKLRPEALEPSKVKSIALKIKKMDGVDDVQYGERWVSILGSVNKGLRALAILLGTMIALGIIFIIYSSIKVLFYRRTEEVETLKLLGATKAIIRGPFLIEGGIIGFLGGAVSLLALRGVYRLFSFQIISMFPGLMAYPVSFLPVWSWFVFLLSGITLGLTGSFIALGRIRY